MQTMMSPTLLTATCDPLFPLEQAILNHIPTIEAWFREQWQTIPAPITSSVDLRHAGFKLAPVDTNLFPAGFNNLNSDLLPLCVQALQALLFEKFQLCKRILIIPEDHTRNPYYFESLSVLQNIISKAGFDVRIGTLRDTTVPIDLPEHHLTLWPIARQENRLVLQDFNPCLVILNNDLSSGIPEALKGLEQPILPSLNLGWSTRSKSTHFNFYEKVATSFSQLLGFDPWLLYPISTPVSNVDFMAKIGLTELADKTADLLKTIQAHYREYGVAERPFAVIKADNGTYGMGVMMVHDAAQVLELNRKQRTKMSASKGGQLINQVILQEGVYTFETMPNGAVAEPVVYMLGQYVVGGFYRVHQGRGKDENLNAPGMHFEPLAFSSACNVPSLEFTERDCPNRFYVYGVIARLAALAAGHEALAMGVTL
jgi:glutamate--cysteine ligase